MSTITTPRRISIEVIRWSVAAARDAVIAEGWMLTGVGLAADDTGNSSHSMCVDSLEQVLESTVSTPLKGIEFPNPPCHYMRCNGGLSNGRFDSFTAFDILERSHPREPHLHSHPVDYSQM